MPEPTKTPTPAAQLNEKLMFRLRLKDRHDIREVIITARSLDLASKVGNAYCEANKYKFIRVENMVVAGEEILLPVAH